MIETVPFDTARSNLPDLPLGLLVAFVSNRDPHSPVMRQTYEEFASSYLEGQVPICYVDVDGESRVLADLDVYSVPTLIWIRSIPADDPPAYGRRVFVLGEPYFEVLLRTVGTVMVKKLVAEAEKILEGAFDL